jgi:hypothetical protein
MDKEKPIAYLEITYLYEEDAQKIIDLSRTFVPASRIDTKLKCHRCNLVIYSNEYTEYCPMCDNFLWVDADYEAI